MCQANQTGILAEEVELIVRFARLFGAKKGDIPWADEQEMSVNLSACQKSYTIHHSPFEPKYATAHSTPHIPPTPKLIDIDRPNRLFLKLEYLRLLTTPR